MACYENVECQIRECNKQKINNRKIEIEIANNR